MPVFDMVIVLGSLMKKRSISILCQSEYFANILAKYFLVFMERIRQIIFNKHFHPYQTAPTCWVNTDQLADQHVGAVYSPFISLGTQDFTTDFW